MGAYGGDTLKPTTLRSNKQWVQDLKRKANKHDLARFANLEQEKGNVKVLADAADGRKRFAGVEKHLKGSQVYPSGHARSVVVNFLRHKHADVHEVESDSSDSDYPAVPGPDHNDSRLVWEDLDADGMPNMMNLRPNVMPVAL